MKTNLGILAAFVVLLTCSLLFVAFKKPAQKFATAHFMYNPPEEDPYGEDNVKDLDNWSYVEDPNQCPTGNNRACVIEVSDTYYNTSSGDPVLNTSGPNQASISTTSTLTGNYKVASTGGGIVDFENKN
jgi:hypothetical protein